MAGQAYLSEWGLRKFKLCEKTYLSEAYISEGLIWERVKSHDTGKMHWFSKMSPVARRLRATSGRNLRESSKCHTMEDYKLRGDCVALIAHPCARMLHETLPGVLVDFVVAGMFAVHRLLVADLLGFVRMLLLVQCDMLVICAWSLK